ncbi:MAG TPA: glutathione binding-like protein [Caulobacteraceae bacterium]|nr:glutathione binding-like protein [Caulobacteraceae bacterium]
MPGPIEIYYWPTPNGHKVTIGQRNHFRNYAPSILADQRQVAYGAIRYTNEAHRLYGVLDKQLAGKDFIVGDYTIADMAAWPWMTGRTTAALDIDEFPNLKAWYARVEAREAVQRAMGKAREFVAPGLQGQAREAQAARDVLFGQRARK